MKRGLYVNFIKRIYVIFEYLETNNHIYLSTFEIILLCHCYI